MIVNIADIFIQELLFEEFDSKPIGLQELEVWALEEKYELYKKRLQKNKGSNAGAKKKHSDETIEFLIGEVEKVKKSNEFLKRKRKNETDITAYVMLVETVLKDPETEELFLDKKWISSYQAARNDEIKRIAKSFQQAVYRYKKDQTRT